MDREIDILSHLCSHLFYVKNKLNALDYPINEPLNEDSLKFNSLEWKKEREYVEEVRPYMLKNLMTDVLKPCMDTLQIKELLGEPLPWGDTDHVLYYRLGVYREVEASYLAIVLDDSSKLKRTYITDM